MTKRRKVNVEHVGPGFWLVDCDDCTTLGVWTDVRVARTVRDQHICGEPLSEWMERTRYKPVVYVGRAPHG